MKTFNISNFSITFKIALSLGLLITFLMVTLGFVTAYNLKQTVQTGEEQQGRYLTEVLSARVAGQLQSGDYQSIKKTVRDFLTESGLDGAIVVDGQGKIVAAEGITRATSMMGDLKDFDATGFKMKYVREKNESDSAFMSIRVVKDQTGKPIGYLGMYSGAGYLHQNTKSLVYYLAGTTLAAIIAGIFLAMVISRRILNRPISDLETATEHIATGDFSMRVNSRSRDELGNLATSFNMMTGYLSNLFRSITTYTGELVKSCQSLNMTLKSTENASRRLVESMQNHAGKTSEHISMLQGCASLADGLVERVEQTGQAFKEAVNCIMEITENAREPVLLTNRAVESVEEVRRNLEEVKKAAGTSREAFEELKRSAGIFSDYLDRSRDFHFKMAMEVARLGGVNLTAELEELQKLADDGVEKTGKYIKSIEMAGRAADFVIDALDRSIETIDRAAKTIAGAGENWEAMSERLAAETESVDALMERLAENERQRKELLETLGYLMEELDKAVREFQGTGEAGEKQAELLGQLESTMRRILRVSNALNNLCMQFKI